MFEDLEVPEQAYSNHSRIAIFRYDAKHYGAKIIDELIFFDQPFLVKDMRLTIPKSHFEQVGADYFSKFLATAFKLMSKPSCEHPLAVLNPLRKKLRRIKRKLVRINPNNSALCWYLQNLYDMLKNMWLAAKNNYLRYLCESRQLRMDTEILSASHIT